MDPAGVGAAALGGIDEGSTIVLYVDGKTVGEGRVERTKRAIADTNCPEVAGPGLNVRFPYRHEECHGCSMC